jgi:hypothetical protein
MTIASRVPEKRLQDGNYRCIWATVLEATRGTLVASENMRKLRRYDQSHVEPWRNGFIYGHRVDSAVDVW